MTGRKRFRMTKFVVNEYGVEIDYNVAVSFMERDICVAINRYIAPCSEQEFFDEYTKRYAQKYGEEWEFAKANPCY